MARRQRFQPTVVRAKQPTNWARLVADAPIVVPAASKILMTTTVLSNPGIGETIRRTHIELFVGSDQSSIIEDWSGAIGGIVVNDLAIGVGVGSIPSPGIEASDDGWFVHQAFSGGNIRATGASPLYARYTIDSKAMRKVVEGFAVAWVVENTSATTGINVFFNVSILTSLS